MPEYDLWRQYYQTWPFSSGERTPCHRQPQLLLSGSSSSAEIEEVGNSLARNKPQRDVEENRESPSSDEKEKSPSVAHTKENGKCASASRADVKENKSEILGASPRRLAEEIIVKSKRKLWKKSLRLKIW